MYNNSNKNCIETREDLCYKIRSACQEVIEEKLGTESSF